ncbi:hypothetical protein T07_5991 [Trichinella nelsoni]|uniref:Uncharacterized protein n=1 Tax=Trichinella nelsoni TaxID=6336 RepID=A0A0V0S8J1_9BILA|nr:hypothetical protein T07_5991 [Trichinella nelsoni]
MDFHEWTCQDQQNKIRQLFAVRIRQQPQNFKKVPISHLMFQQPILRADFLWHFNLLFNRFDHQILIDMTYGLSRMDLSRSAKQNPSVVYGADQTTASKF